MDTNKMKAARFQRSPGIIFPLILAVVLVGCSATPGGKADPATGKTTVPYRYRSLYNELNTQLDSLRSRVKNVWDGRKSDVNFGVELLVTNSNRGEVLLTDRVFRDVYSFWEPLDIMFVENLISLSYMIKADFSCFFWMRYFYGYLDYNSLTKNLNPQQRINAVDTVAGRNILNNTPGNAGVRFKTLVAPQ